MQLSLFRVTEYNVGYVYKIRAGESIKTTNRDSFVVHDPEDKASNSMWETVKRD